MQGAIIAVNFDKSRLQLREADGRIVTVPIDPAAKITREGRASSLQDLAVGQTISVQQANRNGKSVATNIEVLPGNSAAGSSTAPAASQHAAPNPGLQSVPPMPSSTSGSMSGSEATGQKQPDAAPQ